MLKHTYIHHIHRKRLRERQSITVQNEEEEVAAEGRERETTNFSTRMMAEDVRKDMRREEKKLIHSHQRKRDEEDTKVKKKNRANRK
jgi:hypothetical protein